MRRYPEWLKQTFSPDHVAQSVRHLVSDLSLHTVCESARCPNLAECHSQRQLTFMILGERCTRSCRFCAVDSNKPTPVEADEPERVAKAVQRLGLEHVVITSVARDDLIDEGAGHFVRVIEAVRLYNPRTTVEVLVPDFHGREELIRAVVCEGRPEVFAHNIETVRRLSGVVRPQASYARTLAVLDYAASLQQGIVKSSLMVGLGETAAEVAETLRDLQQHGVSHVTLGQYLRPDVTYLPVMEYVSPQRFEEYRQLALGIGFRWVRSGPFVRSSYHAIDALQGEAITATV
jgi:lipoic acid synthetase